MVPSSNERDLFLPHVPGDRPILDPTCASASGEVVMGALLRLKNTCCTTGSVASADSPMEVLVVGTVRQASTSCPRSLATLHPAGGALLREVCYKPQSRTQVYSTVLGRTASQGAH